MGQRSRYFRLASLKKRGLLTIWHLAVFACVFFLVFVLPVVGVVVLVVFLTRKKPRPAQPLDEKSAESSGSRTASRDATPPRP
jgi:heme/copper-type cytochrome/quinol oxidase subunit 2